MAVICPTITAFDPHEYRIQAERLAPFAKRIHIDLMDGEFAPSVSPPLEQIWWPDHLTADIHLMYQRPMDHLDTLIKLKPHMVVIHYEADVDHMRFCAELHKHDIKTGLAILQNTSVESVERIIHSFDHVLVFSGNLGFHGGTTDLGLLDKVKEIRMHHPEAEISWDGGINADNAKELVAGGIQVLNVGGYIQKAKDPKGNYQRLIELVDS